MCRQGIWTDTSLDACTRAVLVDFAITHSVLEEGQWDGWGLYGGEGTSIIKSANSYHHDGSINLHWCNWPLENIWMWHARKASGGTGRRPIDSHPYRLPFSVDGEDDYIVGAHNGYIGGTEFAKLWSADDPQTDSWRAFNQLTPIIVRNGGRINKEVIEEWLSLFNASSVLACLIYHRDKVYAVRGSKERVLFAASIGNGFFVHTSPKVIEKVRNYADTMFNIVVGEAVLLPDNTLTTFIAGELDAVTEQLNFTMRPLPAAVGVAYNTNCVKPYGTSQIGFQTGGSDVKSKNTSGVVAEEKPNVGNAITPYVQQPINRKQNEDPYVAKPKTNFGNAMFLTRAEQIEKLKILRRIMRVCNPMRKDMVLYYIAALLAVRYTDTDDYVLNPWNYIDAEDLESVLETLERAPMRPEQRSLILTWNAHVPRRGEGAFHADWLGEGLFWMDKSMGKYRSTESLQCDIENCMYSADMIDAAMRKSELLAELARID